MEARAWQEIIEIRVIYEGCGGRLHVRRTNKLRDVQENLCDMFQMAFPLMAASLTQTPQQKQFTDFMDIQTSG